MDPRNYPQGDVPYGRYPAPKRGKRYNRFVAYLFINFAILALAFCVIAPLVWRDRHDRELIAASLTFGFIFLAVAALIWLLVWSSAKRRGYSHVMGSFILDGLLIYLKVFMCLTIVLIPFVHMIASPGFERYEDKKGNEVWIRQNVRGEYIDPHGRRYHKVDPDAWE